MSMLPVTIATRCDEKLYVIELTPDPHGACSMEIALGVRVV
jgi:hypothetical protein